MANLLLKPKVTATIVLELTEEEAKALDSLAGYDPKSILKSVGEYYTEKNGAGFCSLMESVRKILPPILSRLNKARAVFNEEKPRSQ